MNLKTPTTSEPSQWIRRKSKMTALQAKKLHRSSQKLAPTERYILYTVTVTGLLVPIPGAGPLTLYGAMRYIQYRTQHRAKNILQVEMDTSN